MRTPYRNAAVVAGAAMALAVTGFLLAPFASSTSSTTSPSTLTVEGQATVNMKPNQAVVSLGDQESAKSASLAMAHSAEVTQAIIRAVETSGVPASEIQTGGLSLNPVYPQNASSNPPTVIGYQASESLTITLTSTALAGPVLDAATAAGSNQINGVTFNITDPSVLYRQAFAAAINDAHSQAQAALAPEHEKILAIHSMTLQNNGSGNTTPEYAVLTNVPDASVPVMVGEDQLSVQVTVVYSIGR